LKADLEPEIRVKSAQRSETSPEVAEDVESIPLDKPNSGASLATTKPATGGPDRKPDTGPETFAEELEPLFETYTGPMLRPRVCLM
jgi:hypothetical protein